MKPIEIWKELINSEANEQEIRMRLGEIYRNNRPFIAEIIMNSHCPSRCLHCIYAPDYDQYNKNMSWEEWKTAFRIIHDNWGLERFIFDGRAITKEFIQAIRFLKKDFPDVKVGLIADGISLEPFLKDLIDCPPDWLDVSVDGLEKDHDIQRNNKGAFRKTLDTLVQLKESEAFQWINILTCLTTLNIQSVTDMIRHVNDLGFKNFFITPVSVAKGYRPDPGLQPGNESFSYWICKLMETVRTLRDSWVEVDIFDAVYAGAINTLEIELPGLFSMEYDHLNLEMEFDLNVFHLRYYPYSLTGIRELIVNSNGDIIPTNVMAMGSIPDRLIFGNVLNQGKGFLESLPENVAFSYCVEEFLHEKEALRNAQQFNGRKTFDRITGLNGCFCRLG